MYSRAFFLLWESPFTIVSFSQEPQLLYLLMWTVLFVFVHSGLCWVFGCCEGCSPAVVQVGLSLPAQVLLLQSTWASVVVVPELRPFATCGIFLDQD